MFTTKNYATCNKRSFAPENEYGNATRSKKRRPDYQEMNEEYEFLDPTYEANYFNHDSFKPIVPAYVEEQQNKEFDVNNYISSGEFQNYTYKPSPSVDYSFAMDYWWVSDYSVNNNGTKLYNGVKDYQPNDNLYHPETLNSPETTKMLKSSICQSLYIPGSHISHSFNSYGGMKSDKIGKFKLKYKQSYNDPYKNSEAVLKSVREEFAVIKAAGRKLFVHPKDGQRDVTHDKNRIADSRESWKPTSIHSIYTTVNSKDLDIPFSCCFGILNCRPETGAWARISKY